MTILTATDIIIKLRAIGVNPAHIYWRDATYAMPTKNWLSATYYPWFRKWLADHKITYSFSWDCEDYATLYQILAIGCHQTTKSAVEGLAIGEFSYVAPTGLHAINFAIVENKELVFIEPQTGQFICLTPEQISSCFFCRF